MNGSVYVGQKALSLTEYDKSAPITGVILWVDDENCYEAGDETGTVIEQDCPYATQQMANNLLATLQGYSYQGLEANGAKVSPIAELGDGITVNGLYTQLAYQNIRFSTGEVMDVAAPGSDETLHEYKTEGETTKWFSHQIAETRSEIIKTSEEITLLIDNEIQGLSSQFTVQLGQIRAELTDEINGLSASVDLKFDGLEASFEDEINGLSADFDVKLNGLQANFEDEINGLSSTLNVKIDGIEASLEDEINGLSSTLNVKIDGIEASLEDEINGLSSTLNVKIDGIEASLEDEINGLSSSINLQIDSITSTVQGLDGQMSSITQTVDSITTRVNGLEGDYSSIDQKVDSLKLAVSNGSTSSTIQLKAGSTIISSENITMSGLVTYTGLSSGTTTINGACIKTGTIDADRLNLTGEITFTDFDNSTQNTINNANTNASTALSTAISVSGTVSGWTYPGTTEINGSAIRTGTVEASILRGGTVELLDQDGDRIGKFTIEPTGLAGLSSVTLSADELYFEAVDPDGQILFYTGDGTGIRIEPGKTIRCDGDFQPRRDDNFWLGSSSRAWQDLYVVNDPSVVSDKSKKTSISYEMGLYEEFFDALKPATYLLKNGTSGRTHIGLISQDVEEALFASNLTSFDFAGFIKSPVLDKNGKETGEYNYALRYGEFIALCIDQIQKLKSRISKMEAIQGV